MRPSRDLGAGRRVSVRKAAYRVLGAISRRTQKLHRKCRRVVYYPAFTSLEELSDHYHRACWYLPRVEGRCEDVVLFHEIDDTAVSPLPRPEHMAPPPAAPEHIRLEKSRGLSIRALFASDLVVFWQENPNRLLVKFLDRFLGIKSAYVATEDPAAVEYGEYCGLLWKYLTPKPKRDEIIEENRTRFATLADQISSDSIEASCVFGTGPSLEKAYDFDFTNTLCIVCNSIVQNTDLLDHIRPRFICAGDVVSHFGVSAYAHQFREDLAIALTTRDVYLFTTATYGSLLLHHYPHLAERICLVEQTRKGPVFDLLENYATPQLDSTLNIHMLPLAATFSRTIWLLGCDGKSHSGDNEDFWTHAPQAQYHDLVESGHLCHPTFDQRRQAGTYDRYLESITRTLQEGQAQGIQYGSLAASNIPVIDQVALDPKILSESGQGAPCRVSELE